MYPVKIQKKASLLIKKCLKKKIKLSFAESCTGGLLSSLITSFPNSSKIFISGFVAYSNLSKERMLGVKGQTKDKKICLVYIGIKSKKGTNVNEFNFKGDRKKIRLNSVEKSIDLIFSVI